MLSIIFHFIFGHTFATELIYTHQSPKDIPIKIVKALPQSHYLSPYASYVFDLISANGSTHTLVCREKDHLNPKKVKSYLIYSNIAHIQVKNFEILGHHLCEELAIYIEAVFEFVDEENFLYLELDTKKHSVSKIILPNLDPYLDRLPEKKKKTIEYLSIN